MKKKITRLSIDGLRKEMPVLSIEEESEVIGGLLYMFIAVSFSLKREDIVS